MTQISIEAAHRTHLTSNKVKMHIMQHNPAVTYTFIGYQWDILKQNNLEYETEHTNVTYV